MTLCVIAVGPNGPLLPEFEAPLQVIGGYLYDLGSSPVMCDEVFRRVRRVQSGDDEWVLFTGDAYQAEIHADHVAIRCIYEGSEPAVIISLPDFVEVLEYWKKTVGDWLSSGRPKDFFAFREFAFVGAKLEEA
jgi:hypothetical protein